MLYNKLIKDDIRGNNFIICFLYGNAIYMKV